MAFATIAQLVIVILVLSIVIILTVTQFAGLSEETNEISSSTNKSVSAAELAQAFSLCKVAGGECLQQDCENYATPTPQGPCPESYYCCKTE